MKVYSDFEYDDLEKPIIDKINYLENKILNFINAKLNIYLTGNEITINLNNKNIGNAELTLLSSVNFKNLEELNLSHNNISDIKSLKDFNFRKLKKLDLSFNKINKIKTSSNENHTFKQNDIQKKITSQKIDINLDNNNLIQKDIEEIKNLILNVYSVSNDDDYFSDFRLNKEYLNNIYNNEKKRKAKLLEKIDIIQKKILQYFNMKLNIHLTGKEIILNLNNKKIGNLELDLLNGVNFKNLEKLILRNNNISNIKCLKNFKNLKVLDLSFNKINNIKDL